MVTFCCQFSFLSSALPTQETPRVVHKGNTQKHLFSPWFTRKQTNLTNMKRTKPKTTLVDGEEISPSKTKASHKCKLFNKNEVKKWPGSVCLLISNVNCLHSTVL